MDKTQEEKDEKNKKPDENGNILIDEHIKIFDPNTKEVFVNKREDG